MYGKKTVINVLLIEKDVVIGRMLMKNLAIGMAHRAATRMDAISSSLSLHRTGMGRAAVMTHGEA